MTWLNRLESKFGHLAIPGLLRFVAMLNGLCFVLAYAQPAFRDFLWLDPARVADGQVWRLFTFIFVPHFGFVDWFWEVIYIMWMFFLGDALESAWGAFKVNVFYLLGVIGTAASGMIFGAPLGAGLIDASLVFAVAHFFPDLVIRLFFVLPVKMKWLAWITAAFLTFNFVVAGWAYRASVIVALANYLLFFGRELIENAKHQQTVFARRARFERDVRDGSSETMHRCKVCGRTELVAPDLEFRVAADGEEYCVDDLPKVSKS